VFVTKRNRLELQNGFARIHRLNMIFETRRGGGGAEATIVIDNHGYTRGHRCSADARNKGRSLSIFRPDTSRFGFSGNPRVADINIVITGGKAGTRGKSYCDVVAPDCVVRKRITTSAVY
jgi:hypothetical protein